MRAAADQDSQDLFGLLALCFAEYPGCFVDPHDDLPDLLAPGRAFSGEGAGFWVIEDARGRIGACIALDVAAPGVAELHRLYVRPDLRRRGLARDLVAYAETQAVRHGATRIVLWSDTRFATAHALYERLGYRRSDRTRILGDVSNTTEHHFDRVLPPQP